MPTVRVSKLEAAGGNITDGFGVITVRAPGCDVPFRIIVGDTRDPFMLAALRVSNVTTATQFYGGVGMVPTEFPTSRQTVSIFEPEQPEGSAYVAHSNNTFGLLLLPPAKPPARFSLTSVRLKRE